MHACTCTTVHMYSTHELLYANTHTTHVRAQVPAVLRRVLQGASASVHRQSVGYFSCFTETGLTVQTVQKTGDSMVQFWEGRRHARCCANDRVMVQTVQNFGVPQLHCSDKFVDVPAVAVHRRLDVPVIMQRRSLAVGEASDSAHRRSQRTIQLQQRRIRFQRG